MLIMDGHGSHTHKEFIKRCVNKKIIPFLLPPHTTHLLQPYDVVCFQPLRHYHTQAVDNAGRTGDLDFNKLEFLITFESIRKQVF